MSGVGLEIGATIPFTNLCFIFYSGATPIKKKFRDINIPTKVQDLSLSSNSPLSKKLRFIIGYYMKYFKLLG